MDKLRILQVHNFYQQPGGEDTVAANEKRLLEHAGHTVVTYYRSNDELAERKGLSKLTVPFTAVFSFRTYRDVRRLLREAHFDIVHVHNTHMMVSPSVFYACLRARVPVVQTLHNFRLACPEGVFFRDGKICEECLKGGLSCALRHKCYRGSRVQTFANAAVTWAHRGFGTYRRINLICLTAFNRDKLLALNRNGRMILDKQKIYIKPNFAFMTKEYAAPVKGAECGEDECAPLLFVGRLEPLKGPLLAVRAMEQLKERTLLIIGDGPLMEVLKSYVSDHGLNNVTFLGRLSQDKLAVYYAKARAVIACSQCYESFPMVVTEAYAHGVPVIAGALGNMNELVIEGKTGYHFKYDDADDLVRAVRKLEGTDLGVMRQNVRAFYEQYLTSEKNLEILEGIYRQMLEKNE